MQLDGGAIAPGANFIEWKCAERPVRVKPLSVRFSARGKGYALAAKGVKSGSTPARKEGGFKLKQQLALVCLFAEVSNYP